MLCKIDLVGAEFGIAKNVVERLEDIVEIALQARPADRCRICVAASFNLGRPNFEVVIKLVAGLRLGSTSAPDFAVDFQHSNFACGFRTRPSADACDAINDREFMVFLKEDHHAIRQFDALRLLWMKRRQRWNRNLLPIGALGCSSRELPCCKELASKGE